jgi:hypothetical protein
VQAERDDALEQLSHVRELLGCRRLEILALHERVRQVEKERDEAGAALAPLQAQIQFFTAEREATLKAMVAPVPSVVVSEELLADAASLREALERKDERILELLDAVGAKTERLAQLESTLKMLAEADIA